VSETKGSILLLETFCVLVIIATVVGIAIPKYADVQRRRAAVRVLEDVETVRTAVYAFYSDSAYFPEESPAGLTPDNLIPYLPRNFVLRRPYGTITYKNWQISNVQQNSGTAANVVGATVATNDPRVAATAANLSPAPKFAVGARYTFVFFGS
jgi:type II secretory pathway pseudopilin PulG